MIRSPKNKRWGALIAVFTAACSIGDPGTLPVPDVRAGLTGELPSVLEVSMADPCSSELLTKIPFTVRFSQAMDTANIEAGLAIFEVRGDLQASVVPLASAPAEIDSKSFRWEKNGSIVSFTADLNATTQYVLTLPETVTNKAGNGLDGAVGADIDGDGNADIAVGVGNLVRTDDDFVRIASPFVSLPFFRCKMAERAGVMQVIPGNSGAPSVWRTPANASRPRVLEFVGLHPTSEQVPRYVPEAGLYSFSSEDGLTVIDKPLPKAGALRIQAASPNTAPTELYARKTEAAPILPSSLKDNFDVIDDELKNFKAGVFLDERLQIPAPFVANIEVVTAPNKFSSPSLAGIADNALAGMSIVFKGHENLTYILPIAGNSGTELTLDPLYFHTKVATRDSDALMMLHIRDGAFRENELRGFRLVQYSGPNPIAGTEIIAEGNTATFVRIQSGSLSSCSILSLGCEYKVFLDLTAMGAAGKQFEVVPTYLFFQTATARGDGKRYRLRLNIGENPIIDIYGQPFIDGAADGNELANDPDDVWEGVFTSGDVRTAPIPPRLQLNDGRYYSPFPGGSTANAVVELGGEGKFVHLAHGIMGRYRFECQSGKAVPQLHDLGLLFATPDSLQHSLGPDDLLNLATINNNNFGLYRRDELRFQPLPIEVSGVTVYTDYFTSGVFIKRQPATLVLLSPSPTEGQTTLAGDDLLCGTSDDRTTQATRAWQPGDRVLLSHRIQFTGADENSLDGNYDGILSNDTSDDMVFEYRPAGAEPFTPIRTSL